MMDQIDTPDHSTLTRRQRQAIKAAVKEALNPEDGAEDRERFRAHLKASRAFHAAMEDALAEMRLKTSSTHEPRT